MAIRGTIRGATATAAIAAMVLLGLPAVVSVTAGGAAAGPVLLPSGNGTTAWAYGAYRTINASGSGHDQQGPYGYSVRAYYGIQVILNQTNVSATQSQVEIQRTLGATAYWTYCRPSCATPILTANITVKALEVGAGFSNLTATGTVYENGSAVSGVALLDSFAESRASLAVSATASLHTLAGSRTSTLNAVENASASARITFDPALGLYPSSPTPGAVWNSSSAYSSQGIWNRSAHGAFANFTGASTAWNSTTSGNVTGNGTLALTGSDSGLLTLADGSTVQTLEFTVTGPFTVREGMIFVPADADLLGPSSPAASEDGPAQADESAGTTSIGVGNAHLPHLGLLTSASTFASASQGGSFASPSTPASGPSPSLRGPVRPAVLPLNETSGPVTLQAQPETVTTAQQSTACLLSGNCPIPAGPATIRAAGLLVAGLVVVAVVAATLLVARRRQVPPPPRPQAELYPPVGAGRAPAPTVPPGARGVPTPPPEGDPLGHLW